FSRTRRVCGGQVNGWCRAGEHCVAIAPIPGERASARFGASYAGAMDATPLALLALLLGAVIGAGVTAMIVAALRARRTADAQVAAELPDGIATVLASMDDAACALDASGVVVV